MRPVLAHQSAYRAQGNPRLNLAFVATLFDKFPKLGPTEEELLKKKNADLECKLGDVEGLLSELTTEKDTLQETLDQTKLDFDQLSMEVRQPQHTSSPL